ncbi:hypothetical protein MAR_030319, partial [Mya arenaria]
IGFRVTVPEDSECDNVLIGRKNRWVLKLNGEMSFYCTYKGLKVLPGKSFTDYHACLKCACDGNGLACNTMGFRVAVPEDSECDNVLIGCKNRWVLKSDNTKKCPKKKIPQNISAVGK